MSKFRDSSQVRQSVRQNCDPRLSGKNVPEWLHRVTVTPAAAPLLMLLNFAKTKPHSSANYSSIIPLSLSICPFGRDCSTKFQIGVVLQ